MIYAIFTAVNSIVWQEREDVIGDIVDLCGIGGIVVGMSLTAHAGGAIASPAWLSGVLRAIACYGSAVGLKNEPLGGQ